MADLIERLKEEGPKETATVEEEGKEGKRALLALSAS